MAPESKPGIAGPPDGPQTHAEIASRQPYRPPCLSCHGSLQELTHEMPVPLNSDGQMGSPPGT
jgi:hypothetical protein